MKHLLITVIAFAVACGPAATTKPEPLNIRTLEVRELDGSLVNPELIKGKKIFLNFWATWCRPCIAEMPSILRAKEKLAADSICFLFASGESAVEIEAFAQAQKLPLHFVSIKDVERLGVSAIPATWIFDRNGNLEFSATGSREWDEPRNIAIIKN